MDEGERAGSVARIRKIMLPKDYLAYRLSGVFCSDYSDASGMLLLDVKHRCWSEEMMELCGVRRDQLPDLYESYDVVGTLKPEVASELGFPEQVKIMRERVTMRQRPWAPELWVRGCAISPLGQVEPIFTLQ